MTRKVLAWIFVLSLLLACGVTAGSVGSVSAVIVADTPCPIVGTIPAYYGRSSGK